MFRSNQRQAPRRAPVRSSPPRNTAPRRPVGPGGRRSGPNLRPILVLGLIVLALGAGAFLFLQSKRDGGAAEAAAAGVVATPAGVVATGTPAPSPTPTLSLVTRESVPGGGEAAAQPTVSAATAVVTGTAPSAPAAAATRAAAPTRAANTPAIRPPAAPAARPTAAATAEASAGAATNGDGSPNLAALGKLMLQRVNADRQANGLQPVEWDAVAATAGQKHSEEMAQFGYMSHWNMDGYGPEYRYSRAGGLDMSQENVYRLVHQWQDGRGAPIDDWDKVVADAENALMHSPGHRANILGPAHTHLGVGIAYNPSTGNVAISQEFVNRYVAIQPVPKRGQPGDRLVLRGQLLPGSSEPLVNLAYEPLPKPITLDELNKTSTYKSPAEHLSVPQVKTDAQRRFVSEFTLDKNAPPGLYHVWVWVKAAGGAEPVQAVDAIIEVSR